MVRKITHIHMRVNLKREQNYFVAYTATGGKETSTITNSAISSRIELTTASRNVEANVKMFQFKNIVKLHGMKHLPWVQI